MLAAALILLAAASPQTAPVRPAPAAAPGVTAHVQLELAKDHATVPFEYWDGHIIFQVEIGGQRVWMLLDTGSVHDVIDVGLAKRLGLPIIPMQGTVHVTGGHEVPKQRVDDVALVVPRSFSLRLPMLAMDMKGMAFSGGPIQAVLGHDLTSHFLVVVNKRTGELDFVHGQMTLHSNTQPITPIAVTTVEDRDQVQALAAGKLLRLTLDTGSGVGVDFTPEAWAKVKPQDAQVFRRDSRGGAAVTDTEIASRLPALTIGGTTVRDVEVRVGPELPGDGDGRIGMGVLSRYSFVLDAPHGQLWLIPAATDTSKLVPPTLDPPK